MAGKKHPGRKTPSRPQSRANTPLVFLLLILIPLFGGYYNFSVFLAGALLTGLLVWEIARSGSLQLPTGPALWVLCGICAGHLLSIPGAVSGGMAFTGFLRSIVWLLFFLYAATYTHEERRMILDTVAWEGALLALMTICVFLYNRWCGVSDSNGRIDGPFQYANTWAIFLVVCLILLTTQEKKRPLHWGAMSVLLVGLCLSGSRGSFLLLLGLCVLYAGYVLFHTRRVRPVAQALCAGAALVGLSILLSGGLVLERLQAITLSSSSLNGRLLYDLDGLALIADHPMGTGRGGYLYLQPLYQTGVYILRYIHNEYLQAALDGGLLAGLCTLLLPLCLMIQKHLTLGERAVIAAVALHAFIDFDFQFTAVVLILLLCGAGGKCRAIPLPKGAALAGGSVLAAVLCFFSLTYWMDFSGDPQGAYALFPADLSLAENRLQSCAGIADGEGVADEILTSTDLSMLAWDCKYAAALQRGDGVETARAKYQYLRLNQYRGEVYEEFTALLEHLSARASQEELLQYAALAKQAADQLEEVNTRTSPLAYRIAERPDLAFADSIIARLNLISGEKG